MDLNLQDQLGNLDLSGVAITAAIDATGTLSPVGGVAPKVLAASDWRSFPRIHTAVIAKDQPLNEAGLEPVPPLSTVLRDPHNDFYIIRAETVEETAEILESFQSNLVLKLLKQPLAIAEYLLGGNYFFCLTLSLIIFLSWYLSEGIWFILIYLLLMMISIILSFNIVKKYEKKSIKIHIFKEYEYSLESWKRMFSSLPARKTSRFLKLMCTWVARNLSRKSLSHRERWQLAQLPRLWRRHWLHALRLVFPILVLGVLLFPSQYGVGEALSGGIAGFIGGTSRIMTFAEGQYVEDQYVPVIAKTEPGSVRVLRTVVQSEGWIRLTVADKSRTGRWLCITSDDGAYLLREHPTGMATSPVKVPIRKSQATFYYVLTKDDVWSSILKIEILSHFRPCTQDQQTKQEYPPLEEADLYIDRTINAIPSSVWQGKER